MPKHARYALAATASLLVVLTVARAETPAPRTVFVYSDFSHSSEKAYFAEGFEGTGWKFDAVENVEIAELAGNLGQYDIVMLAPSYNLSNTQPFGEYARQWRRFLVDGGVLYVTDAELWNLHMDKRLKPSAGPAGFTWLSRIDPRLSVKQSRRPSEYFSRLPAWVSGHPLTRGGQWHKTDRYPGGIPINDYGHNGLRWEYYEQVSPCYTPLVKDPGGRTMVAVQSLGKGLVVISAMSGFANYPVFIRNLWEYARDPQRIDRDSGLQPGGEPARRDFELADLPRRPSMDADPDAPPWSSVTESGGFRESGGKDAEAPTFLRAGVHGSDLYLQFRCSGAHGASRSDRDSPGIQFQDCVEIYAEPAGDGPQRRFVVNALGAMLDEQDSDPAWSGWWQASARTTPDGWIVVVRLPFSTLGVSGSGWSLNFARVFPANDLRPESKVWLFPVYPESLRVRQMACVISPEVPASRAAISIPTSAGRLAVDLQRGAPLPVRVSASATEALDGLVTLEPVDGETGALVKAPVEVPRGAASEVALDAPLPTGNATRVQLALRRGEDVLASSSIYTVTTLDYLAVSLVRPNYRNLIQSRDKVKRVEVLCAVTPPKPGRYQLAMSRRLRVDPAGTPRVTDPAHAVCEVREAGEYPLSMDAAHWEPGMYDLVVTLGEPGAGSLSERMTSVQVAEPSGFEVSFGFNGAAYVNGTPFFPLGLYGIDPYFVERFNELSEKAGLPTTTMRQVLAKIKAQGFNTAITHDNFAHEQLDEVLRAADEVGVHFVLSGTLSFPLAELVAKAKHHQSVLAWYGVDEMSDAHNYLNRATVAYGSLRNLDPHRPVISAVNSGNTFLVKRTLAALDILMPDHYPVPRHPMDQVPESVLEIRQAIGSRAANWIVCQAFKYCGRVVRSPEVRWMAFAAIACGAQGLMWYTYQDPTPWVERIPEMSRGWYLPDSQDLWDGFARLNAEVRTLSLPILEGVVRTDIRAPEGVYFRALEHEGKLYLIAANGARAQGVASMVGAGLSGVFEVLGEERSVMASGGVLQDDLEPYTAHIYVGQVADGGAELPDPSR